MKKVKTRQEDRTAAKDYLKKAEDNSVQMLAALANNNYNAAGTLAIQCAISSADAICVHEKGIRSISGDHFDVCDLVRSVSLPEADNKSKHSSENYCQKEPCTVRKTRYPPDRSPRYRKSCS